MLENEVVTATEELLTFLPALDLETSVHSQAVKEFSQAFDVILKGYDQENITYDVGYDLIHQIKGGFIEGAVPLEKLKKVGYHVRQKRLIISLKMVAIDVT